MRQLSVGVTTCLALTEDGEALAWGRGVAGRPAVLPAPTPLPELQGRAVLGVCCGPAQVSGRGKWGWKGNGGHLQVWWLSFTRKSWLLLLTGVLLVELLFCDFAERK